MEDAHHLVVGQDRRDRIEPAGQRLAHDHHVRPHALVLTGEELARTAQAGLDLVRDEQDLLLATDLLDLLEIALGRDDDPALTLDRLDEDAHHVGVDRLAQCLDVAVGQQREARREGAEPFLVRLFVGEADDGRGASVEVAGEDQNLGLVFLDALDVVAPFSRRLDRRLDGLRAGVHRQHPLVAGHGVDFRIERAELVRAEGA